MEFLVLKNIAVNSKKLIDVYLDQNDFKDDAYDKDSSNTTHSLMLDVPDTTIAEEIYDDITYNKGAAVLSQLHFLLGNDGFRKSMNRYFNTFKFKNASFNEFIQSMEEEFA